MEVKQNYYLLTLMFLHMKSKLFTKSFGMIKINLIIVIILKTLKKVIGKFKDEATGIPITEFIALR